MLKYKAVLFILCVFFCSVAFAQYQDETDEGRYMIRMVRGTNGTGTVVAKTPVVVLDTAMGVVWSCPNIQSEKPVWVRVDLGRNTGKALSPKRYALRMLEWPSTEFKIPAAILDTVEGKVWTCPNLFSEDAMWIPQDLVNGATKDVTKQPDQDGFKNTPY